MSTENNNSGTLAMPNVAGTEGIMKRRALMLESLNLIPIYSGQDPTWTLAQFRNKFLGLAGFLHWPPEDHLFAIQQRLAGLALETYINFIDNIKTTDDLFKILQDKFVSKKDQGDLLNDFWLFKQQPEMSVAEFIAKASIKANAAIAAHTLPPECVEATKEQWLMSMIEKNLIPAIRKGVIARSPANLRELEKVALLEEKAFKAVPPQFGELSESVNYAAPPTYKMQSQAGDKTEIFASLVKDLTKQIHDLSDKVSRLENTANKKESNSNIICHYCLKRGHVQRFCDVKRSWARGNTEQQWTRNGGPSFPNVNRGRGNAREDRGEQTRPKRSFDQDAGRFKRDNRFSGRQESRNFVTEQDNLNG